MDKIYILKNRIQEYAWGSYKAIPELLGQKKPSEKPQAELWMGAHPKASSELEYEGKQMLLSDLIQKEPEKILGKAVAEKFGGNLPYLFKVLAAAKPLSVQAHPDAAQAIQGFEKENRLNIPLDAPNRNYKDSSHKPECICALSPFRALKGFRPIHEILFLTEKICPQGLKKERLMLEAQATSEGLKQFFQSLMTMPEERKKQIIAESLANAGKFSAEDPAFREIPELHKEYPSDIGVLSPLFLNLICLAPGQAMFLPAGELHSYLDGVGLELMANSDNVLRGGLTPKHIDVPELLNVLTFEAREVSLISPRQISEYERVYPTPAPEFCLSAIYVTSDMSHAAFSVSGVEILLCTAGNAEMTQEDGHSVPLSKGVSVIVPAAAGKYNIKGNSTIYKASVPL